MNSTRRHALRGVCAVAAAAAVPVAALAKRRDDETEERPDDGLSVVTLDYDTMAPTLRRGSMVIVDRSIRRYVREGLYLMHNGAAELDFRGKVVATVHVVDPCGLRDARVRLAAGRIGGGDHDLERLAGREGS